MQGGVHKASLTLSGETHWRRVRPAFQGGSTLNTTWRWWETFQGSKSSRDRYWNTLWVKRHFGPLIRVILYDSNGLRLKASIAVLWALRCCDRPSICLWGVGSTPPFIPSLLPSSHRSSPDGLTLQSPYLSKNILGVPWEAPPIALGVIKKTVEFACGVCCRGWVPAHPRKLLCERVMV